MSCKTCKGFNIKIQNLIKESFLTEATTGTQFFSVNKPAVDKFLEPRINACYVEIATSTSQKIVELKRSDYLEDAGFKNNIKQIVEKYVNEILTMDNLKKLFSESITNSNLENFDLGKTNSEKQNKVNNLANNIADSIGQILNYIQYVFGGLVAQMGIKAGDAAVRVNKLQKIKRSTKEDIPPAVPLPNVGPGQTDLQEIKIKVLKRLKEDEERTSSRYLKGPASSEIYSTYQDLARWFKNHTPKDSIDEDVVDYVKMILSPYYEKKYGFQTINTSVDNTNHRIAPDMNPEIYSGIDAGKLVHQGAWQIYINPKNDKWFPERTRPKPNYNPFDPNNPEVSKAADNITHSVLDILGVFDPTGIADGTNFLWYMNEYQNADSEKEKDRLFFQAATSLLGAVLPYTGDILKITNIGARIKIAFPLLKRIRSFISPKSAKLNRFFDSLETLFNDPKKMEKLLAGTEISTAEIIKKSFLEITSEIVKASMKAPFQFIKNIPLSTKEAELIRKAYLNTALTQSIIYNALNSKAGIEFMTGLLSIPFDFAKVICEVIYSEKDIHNTLQTLAQDKMFAEKAEGKTILSRFRNVAIPYFEQIEYDIHEAVIAKSKNLQVSKNPINESKIKIFIINNDLLNEGTSKEAVETVVQTIIRRSVDIEAVIKSIDDILPSIMKSLDSKSLLRILEKIKIRIKLTEADLSSIKRGIAERETKIKQLANEEREISDKLFDLNRQTVKTAQENAEIKDLTTKIQAKQKEKLAAEDELTNLKKQAEPRIKEKEAELQKLKEKETELNNKQREIEQEPSKWSKLKDRVAGASKGYSDWMAKYPRSNRILLTGLLYFVGNLICRSIAISVLAWWAAKQTMFGSILQKIEDIIEKILLASGLTAIGGAVIIDAYQKGKQAGGFWKGVFAAAKIVAMRLSVFVGCFQGGRQRLVVEGAKILDATGAPAAFDTISQRFAAASEASEEEIQDALYGEFNDSWFNKLVDALPVPTLYGDYGKIGNQFIRKTDLVGGYFRTTFVGKLIADYGVDSKEVEEFGKKELEDKFFVSVLTVGQLILIRKFLISKGIKEPQLLNSFITCIIKEVFKNLVTTAKTQTSEQKKAFKEKLEAISVFFKFNGDVLGMSDAASADETAIRNVLEREIISLNEKLSEYIDSQKINLPGMPAGFGNNPDFNNFYRSIKKHLDRLNQKDYNTNTGKEEIRKNYEILNIRIEEKITYYEKKYPANTPEAERYKKNNIDFYKMMKEKNRQLYENVINNKITDHKGLNIELSQQDFYTCDKIKQEYSSVWNEAVRIIDITKGFKIEVGDIVTFVATGVRFRVVSVQKEEGTITIKTDKGEEKFNQYLFTISEKGKK